MKHSSAFFLQVVIVLFGLGALSLMLWEPHLEGRNVHATNFEIYFKDPFLAYVYLGSLPFYFALYRAFGLFGHVRRTGAFSERTVDSLRSIRRCALTLMGFIAGGVVIILLFGDKEDRPAGLFMSLLATLISGIFATASAISARRLHHGLRQSEDHQP